MPYCSSNSPSTTAITTVLNVLFRTNCHNSGIFQPRTLKLCTVVCLDNTNAPLHTKPNQSKSYQTKPNITKIPFSKPTIVMYLIYWYWIVNNPLIVDNKVRNSSWWSNYTVWRLINNLDFASQFNNSGITKFARKVNPDSFCLQKMIHFTIAHFPGTTNGA